jgi:hypothetical protein
VISTKSVIDSFHFSIPDDIDSNAYSIETEDIDPQSGKHFIHRIQIDANRLNTINWHSAKQCFLDSASNIDSVSIGVNENDLPAEK